MTNTTRTKLSGADYDKESLLEVENHKVQMTLNTETSIASGLLIQRLTELYDNPIEATIRETVSNALDAVTESFSGKKPKVEIESPTKLNPIFKVKDNGVGMSYEDLKNIYYKYGASTKANDFVQIGAYGLGAKAPLSYATDFTVTSTKDGFTTTIIVVREELTNYIKIVSSEKTGKASGTTVSVPVSSKDVEDFKDLIESNYNETPYDSFNAEVLIDGDKAGKQDFILIKEDLLTLKAKDEKDNVYSRIWIKKDLNDTYNIPHVLNNGLKNMDLEAAFVIGGWVYKSPSSNYRYNERVYIELKPGVVSFNSSRDHITENERYYNLKNLVDKYFSTNEIKEDLKREICNLEVNEFKNLLKTLYESSGSYSKCFYKDKRVYFEAKELNDLIHNETGYSINTLLSGFPKDRKRVASYEQNQKSWLKRPSHYSYCKVKSEELHGRKRVISPTECTITEIRKYVKKSFESAESKETLENLFLHHALYNEGLSFTNNYKEMLIVTDVKKEDIDFFLKAQNKKVLLDEMKTQDKSFAFTEYTKKEVEKAAVASGINSDSLKIMTSSEAEKLARELAKALREKNKKQKEKANKDNVLKFSPEVRIYCPINKITSSSNFDKIKEKYDSKKKIIIIAKSINSYLNRNDEPFFVNDAIDKIDVDLKENEVEVFFTLGSYRKSDLEMVQEFNPELFVIDGDTVGYSKAVKEMFKNELKMKLFREKEENKEEKAFLHFTEIIAYSGWNVTLKEILVNGWQKNKEIIDYLGIDLGKLKYADKIRTMLNEVESKKPIPSFFIVNSHPLVEEVAKNLSEKGRNALKKINEFSYKYYNSRSLEVNENGELINISQEENLHDLLVRAQYELDFNSEDDYSKAEEEVLKISLGYYIEAMKELLEHVEEILSVFQN